MSPNLELLEKKKIDEAFYLNIKAKKFDSSANS